MVAVAALVVIAAIAVAVALLGGSSDGERAGQDSLSTVAGETSARAAAASEPSTSTAVTPTSETSTVVATVEATTTTVTPTTAATTTAPAPVVETTEAPIVVPAPTGDEQLAALLDADRDFVIANMLGGFVVQVNAKFIDQVDDLDGRFYDAQAIVDTYHVMEQLRGPIVIIRQDEFNHTEPQPDLFQMLLRETFPSQAAGRAWCDASGLSTDDCLARARPLTLP